MSYLGWKAIRVIEEKERLLEKRHWDRYAHKLTREERSRIAHGDYHSILRKHKPEWRQGDELEAASNLTIVVQAVRWRRGGYRTAYSVRDFRAHLLRRVPKMHEPPAVDEYGHAIPPTLGAIADARIDGNYTADPSAAVTDAGESPDDALHRRLHGEVAMANAMQGQKRRTRLDKMRLEMRLAEARSKNWRSTVRYLERVQEHHAEKTSERAA